MTCYLRHLKDLLQQAGINPVGKKERYQVDQAIRDIVGIKQMDITCPAIWQEVKAYLQKPSGEKQLIQGLRQKLGS